MRAFLFLLPISSVFAIVTGNPADPGLLNHGLIWEAPLCSVRIGYVGDYVFDEHFQDEELNINGCIEHATLVKMYTNAALCALNFADRLDLYTILGASKLQIDEEIFSTTRFSWGLGAKALIFHRGRFFVGADVKYFETDQKPPYFVCDHSAYNITNDFFLRYTEIQGSLGLCYRTEYVAPYLNASYIASKISPSPSVALVRLPTMDFIVDVPSKSIINQNRWGLSLGATLIDHRKASLSVEWRALNQNSIDVNGEIRF